MFYRGKHVAKGTRSFKMNKVTVMVASLVLLFTFVIGGTMAWLADTTEPVVNVFKPVEVKTEIQETVNGNVKSNVQFKNNGDIPAYIRATVAVYWMKGDKIVPAPDGATITGIDSIGPGWFKVGDIYYYEDAVDPYVEGQDGGFTSVLFSTITVNDAPEGYTAKLNVFVEGIQADPSSAVEEAWADVNVSGEKLVPAAAN